MNVPALSKDRVGQVVVDAQAQALLWASSIAGRESGMLCHELHELFVIWFQLLRLL